MRIVVCPDKFKGSLSAIEVAESIARGVARVYPDAIIDQIPMADGGEGTVEALIAATGGSAKTVSVTGPLGDPVQARFGFSPEGSTAFLEMAAASGLVLVPEERRDPSQTSTYGTGELIRAALDLGVRRIVIGIGGSATNDGGAGMAAALGYRFLDAEGREIEPSGGGLASLARIDPEGRDQRLDHVEIAVACDVDNPLCGPEGAAAIYGPQKGANAAMVAVLDANLERLAERIEDDLGKSVATIPGAGAAGGLGAGLVGFAGGHLGPGVDFVVEAVQLRDRLQGALLCITGEGRIDQQTARGKTIAGVGRLAESVGVPVLALGGSLGDAAESVLDLGVDALFSIVDRPMSLTEAIDEAACLLSRATEHAFRAFLAGRSAGSA